MATPGPPPRISDPAQGFPALVQWIWDFYQKIVIEGLYLKVSDFEDQGTVSEFDLSNLPDPASATIATAQQTANEAYTLGAQAYVLAAAPIVGQVTISDTDTSGDLTFSDTEEDADYTVSVVAVGYTGTPTIDAFQVITVTKATDKLTIETNAAPGAGNSVTFDVIARR